MNLAGEISAQGIRVKSNTSSISECCMPRHTTIKYKDILSIKKSGPTSVKLVYLDRSGRPFRLKESNVVINCSRSDNEELWMAPNVNDESPIEHIIEFILSRAFGPQDLVCQDKAILILINPFSGSGRAYKQYMDKADPIFKAANAKIEVVKTKFAGHGRKFVMESDLSQYSAIICVSGDGLVHEVLNGLCDRKDAVDALQTVGIAQLPGGSGNALTLSLNNGEKDWGAVAVSILKGHCDPIDIMAVTQENNTYYSFLSQTYGIVAGCDLGTESLRWMGSTRFALGIVYRSVCKQKYPCEIAYKEVVDELPPSGRPKTIEPEIIINDEIPSDWRVETIKDMSMFWVGKLPWMSSDAKVFPMADFTDGCMDMLLWGTSFGLYDSLESLAKLETGNHVKKAPFYKKVSSYRVTPLSTEKYFSVDGEAYPASPFHVTVIPKGAKFVIPAI